MEAGDPRSGEEARRRQATYGETRWPCHDTTACRPAGRGEVRSNPTERNQTNTANRHAAFDRWPDITNSHAYAAINAGTHTTRRSGDNTTSCRQTGKLRGASAESDVTHAPQTTCWHAPVRR